MRAIQIAAPGSSDQLRLVEVDRPVPGEGEILVRVAVAGVNFADTMQRRDAYFAPVTFPFIPGVEVAGHVEEVGPQSAGWSVGDRVAGVILGRTGGYAEFVVLAARHAAKVPEALGFEQATAVLNQGLTAQGLLETAPEAARGASVLVTAAGGGVGGMLVQLARLGGAGTLIAAASDVDKLAVPTSLGAVALSYAAEDWPRQVRAATGGRGADVVFDGVGGNVRQACAKAVATRGRIVFYGAASGDMGVSDALLTQVLGKCASLTGYSIYVSIQEDPGWLPRTLERLFALAAQGELRTPMHPPFEMSRAPDAHAAIEGRKSTGKILIRIAPPA